MIYATCEYWYGHFPETFVEELSSIEELEKFKLDNKKTYGFSIISVVEGTRLKQYEGPRTDDKGNN